MAICSLVGKEIGAGQINQAREVFRKVFTFCLVVGVFEVIALYFTRRHIVRIFTETLKIEDATLVCVLVCIFFDYCQGVLCGVIKALG